jgi:hypothetical protein
MRKIFSFVILFALASVSLKAQVSSYTFAQSSSTYTELSTGTILQTGSFDDAQSNITIPFTFNFNGADYTSVNIVTNGFVYFGSSNSNLASYLNASIISGTVLTTGGIAPWARDINGFTSIGGRTSEIRWATLGTAPNRYVVIQYKNIRPAYSTSSTTVPFLNYQVHLYETSNIARIVYGSSGLAAGTLNTSTTAQIGLRGATNADFNNRTNSTSVLFNSSTAGTANSSTQAFSSVTSTPGQPANGLTYTFTPPSCSAPGGISASNLAPTTTTISWNAASPAPSGGYNYEVRTSGAAGSGATGLAVSGTTAAGVLTANISGLTANTAYTVYVRSNCGGGTLSSWSSGVAFTTPCNPETAPTSNQPFSTYVPSCWFEATGALAAPSTVTAASNDWTQTTGSFANVSGTANRGVKYNL